MITSILFLAGLAALPATGESARLRVDLFAEFGGRHFDRSYSSQYPNGFDIRGDAGAGVTVFLRPVVDDDDVPSLQPFLQRASLVHLETSGGGSSVYEIAHHAFDNTTASFETHAGGYLTRWLYGEGGFSLSYVGFYDGRTVALGLSPYVDVGLRFGNVLLRGGWSIPIEKVQGGPYRVDFWGAAFLSTYAVLRHWVTLSVNISVIDQGSLASAQIEFWLRRRLGIGFVIDGGAAAYANSHVLVGDSSLRFSRAGGSIGVHYFSTPTVEFGLAYAFHWNASTPETETNDGYTHLFLLSLSLRPLSRSGGLAGPVEDR